MKDTFARFICDYHLLVGEMKDEKRKVNRALQYQYDRFLWEREKKSIRKKKKVTGTVQTIKAEGCNKWVGKPEEKKRL